MVGEVKTLVGAASPLPPEGMLTTAEAASRLGITQSRLYRLLDAGVLPCARFGRVIRVSKVEVERLRLVRELLGDV